MKQRRQFHAQKIISPISEHFLSIAFSSDKQAERFMILKCMYLVSVDAERQLHHTIYPWPYQLHHTIYPWPWPRAQRPKLFSTLTSCEQKLLCSPTWEKEKTYHVIQWLSHSKLISNCRSYVGSGESHSMEILVPTIFLALARGDMSWFHEPSHHSVSKETMPYKTFFSW